MRLKDIPKELYRRIIMGSSSVKPVSYSDKEASDLIMKGLQDNNPFLCARLGCTELQSIIFADKASKPVLKWLLNPFWNGVLDSVHNSSGVFNIGKEGLLKFSAIYKECMREIDLLGSWHPSENYFQNELKHCERITLWQMGPDIENDSWTRVLAGKRVLVVSPFADTIMKQYSKRQELFPNPNVLPEFGDLITIKAVQSIAGNRPQGIDNWFEALSYMEDKMVSVDYDIALLGCGAYGLPLSVSAKRRGKKVVLLGGSLQLLFGIWGRRWAQPGIDFKNQEIMNRPAWVRPSKEETPNNIEKVPGSGYW